MPWSKASSKSRERPLKADSLLGTAYTLKALLEWRLGDFNSSINTVEKTRIDNVKLFPRDRALLDALPSLIKNDQAKQFMDTKSESFETVANLLKEASDGLDQLTGTDPSMNSMRFYLLTSQLGVLKNWIDLIDETENFIDEDDIPSPDDLDEFRETWCSQSLKGVWDNFAAEVDRLNSAGACTTYNDFFNLLGPDGCTNISVEGKKTCDDLN